MVLAVGIGCWKLDATTQPWALQGRQESLAIPILNVGGDHDIIFPVENWYALNQQLPTVQLLTFPQAGHGPHHEHPEAAAEHIATFVRTAK